VLAQVPVRRVAPTYGYAEAACQAVGSAVMSFSYGVLNADCSMVRLLRKCLNFWLLIKWQGQPESVLCLVPTPSILLRARSVLVPDFSHLRLCLLDCLLIPFDDFLGVRNIVSLLCHP
jgi:hypothetical protein